MAICCAQKSLPRDTKSPSATRVAEEMHFIPFARILDPFYLFPPFFLAPFFRAISFPPFQPTIASRATDNVISICIYVPTVPSTGFFYTVIHTRYHFANWFLSPIRDEPILPRILRSFPFISLSLLSISVCSINPPQRELRIMEKIIFELNRRWFNRT